MGASVVRSGQQSAGFYSGQTMPRLVPGQNIMAQLVGAGRKVVVADNMHDELTDGDAPRERRSATFL